MFVSTRQLFKYCVNPCRFSVRKELLLGATPTEMHSLDAAQAALA
jgi:hypothetical protein